MNIQLAEPVEMKKTREGFGRGLVEIGHENPNVVVLVGDLADSTMTSFFRDEFPGTTTTPLQALVLLNNPVYVEAARMLGQRLLLEGGKTDAERLAFGFRLCTSRAPSEQELAILSRLLEEQRSAYLEDEKGARKLLEVGDAEADESLDVRELATWAAVASALLNLDATIHRS